MESEYIAMTRPEKPFSILNSQLSILFQAPNPPPRFVALMEAFTPCSSLRIMKAWLQAMRGEKGDTNHDSLRKAV